MTSWKKNPNKLKIVFKHLPLNMHKQARPAALAAIAAQEQGKFWPMHDALFTLGRNLNTKSINKAAQKIGLNMDQFKRDLDSAATQKKLKKDMIDAGKASVSGTPTLFINGRQVKARGADILQKMVDQESASKGL